MRAWVTPELTRYFSYRRIAPEDFQSPDRPSENHVWIDGAGWAVPSNQDFLEAERIFQRADYEPFDRLIFEVLWNMENRMRAQEGATNITRLAYRNALINQLRQLRAQVSGPSIADSEGEGNGTESGRDDQH